MVLIQSLRMTLRDYRAGELRFLLIAIIVAVSALSSVSFFVERMRGGLERDAHQLLGADLVIVASEKLDPKWQTEAEKHNLKQAETQTFASMATAGEGNTAISKLASIKAVSSQYPLRGSVQISNRVDEEGTHTSQTPSSNTVWVDSLLLSELNASVGDPIILGDTTFTISHILVVEPDRRISFVSLAPRVMMSLSDLEKTGLIQPASRVTYRLLLSGTPEDVAAYKKWADTVIDSGEVKGIRLESLESSRPEMNTALARGEQFLSLVGLLSAMLAAVAIGMAARRFVLRHLDACAMLRCLGMTQNQVTGLYLIEFLFIGIVGCVLGALLGFGAHFVLLEILGQFILKELPPFTLLPAIKSIAIGLLLLLSFAIPPILQLRNVSHNRVIRREREAPKPLVLLTYGFGLIVFIALLLWQAGSIKLGLITAGGFLAGITAFALLGWLGLRLLKIVRNVSSNPDWLFAMTSLQRRPAATLLQIVSLAIGLMALLLLTTVRADLIQAWKNATPADTPNHFMINILTEQKTDIKERMKQGGIADPQLFPMVRGRLVEINNQTVVAKNYQEERAQRLVEREFNLSYMMELPAQNQIVQGQWLDNTKNEASVEEGLAETLNLKIGDQLTFDITGTPVQATITSLRKLEWSSIRVNFFVILNPALLEDMPQTWITSFYLPKQSQSFITQMTHDFPNLTIFDVRNVITQIQTVLDQVALAVEFLFLFTLASGLLVLYAALIGSQEERMREASLLRALGATRSQLQKAQHIEFLLIGSIGGLLAATGADLIGWILATQIFHFSWTFNPIVWLIGLVSGVLCAVIGGWLGLRNVINHPPLQTLREA